MKYLAVIVLLIGGLVGLFGYRPQSDVVDRITIGENSFIVEIADSEAERAQGLSGRTELGQDKGMLFIMSSRDRHVFWMKDMRFPLDIIWIDGDTIVDIDENVPVPVNDDIARVQPSTPVNVVLEIEAGEAKRLGISVGKKVTYTKKSPTGDSLF